HWGLLTEYRPSARQSPVPPRGGRLRRNLWPWALAWTHHAMESAALHPPVEIKLAHYQIMEPFRVPAESQRRSFLHVTIPPGCSCVDNRAIASIFYEAADLMEINGDASFRIRSYRRAAEVIEGLPQQVSGLIDEPKKLLEIPGIGK